MSLTQFRGYQLPVFQDHGTKTLLLHWSRQIGKSFTLANWSIDRLLRQLQRHPRWLITVLSNSKDNGAEFALKCQETCERLGMASHLEGCGEEVSYEDMRFEIRLRVRDEAGQERVGRIKVLAANPRTARGFSGDLILDEFAFHEDSRAIWEASEPIISANPEFLCRIASTGNGRKNMFYQLIAEGRLPVNRVRRSDAWARGELKIFSLISGREITPEEARTQASDKRAYDQNYECAFEDENMALLTHELISAAERAPEFPVDQQEFSLSTLQRLHRLPGDLYAGYDVARVRDLSVIMVLQRLGPLRRLVAMLEMEAMRLPAQQRQAEKLFALPAFRGMAVDMTGLGLGVFESLQEKFGGRVSGVDFSTSEPVSDRLRMEGRRHETARVTELMALDLVELFEERRIEILPLPALRDDLRKPEKLVSPTGRVSIAAARDAEGHADRFWALALAERRIRKGGGPVAYEGLGRLVMNRLRGRCAA